MTQAEAANDPVTMFDLFTRDVGWWGSRAEHLSTLPNGFEKWLATEWLLWMKAIHGFSRDAIGIEYKAQLAAAGDDPREQKQVDLWWAAGPPRKGPWNFVELKVVFDNQNKDKMFTSAGWDLWYLSRLDRTHERPNAAAVIVVGSGFKTPEAWKKGITTVTDASGNAAEPRGSGVLGALKWQAWTLTFPS